MLPFKSLDGATVTGPGITRDLENTRSQLTMIATETSGGPHSDMTVRLEGSHDGESWLTLTAVSLTTSTPQKAVTVDQHLVRYTRAVILDPVTGSFSVTATIAAGDA